MLYYVYSISEARDLAAKRGWGPGRYVNGRTVFTSGDTTHVVVLDILTYIAILVQKYNAQLVTAGHPGHYTIVLPANVLDDFMGECRAEFGNLAEYDTNKIITCNATVSCSVIE